MNVLEFFEFLGFSDDLIDLRKLTKEAKRNRPEQVINKNLGLFWFLLIAGLAWLTSELLYIYVGRNCLSSFWWLVALIVVALIISIFFMYLLFKFKIIGELNLTGLLVVLIALNVNTASSMLFVNSYVPSSIKQSMAVIIDKSSKDKNIQKVSVVSQNKILEFDVSDSLANMLDKGDSISFIKVNGAFGINFTDEVKYLKNK